MSRVPFARVIALALGVFALGRGAALAVEEEISGVVAIVGNDLVTRESLDEEVNRRIVELQASGRYDRVMLEQGRPILEQQLVEELVRHKLVLQAAERKFSGRRIEEIIPETRVAEEIDRRLRSLQNAGHNVRTREDYYELQLRDFGRSRESVVREIRESMLVQGFLWEEVFQSVDRFIPPRELRAYYRENKQEFTTPVEVTFRRIVFRPDFRVQERVEAINGLLESGADFVDVARVHSDEFEDPALRGRVWTKTYEQLLEWGYPYPQVIKKLKKGEYSGPHQHRNLLFFIRVEELVEGQPPSYDEVQQQIERKLIAERHAVVEERYLERLKDRAGVEILLPALPQPSASAPAAESEKDSGGAASNG